jgi:hypothetical protein
MKTRWTLLLPALFVSVPLLLHARPAAALTAIQSPFGSDPVNVFIGDWVGHAQLVAIYQDANTFQCAPPQRLGPPDALDDATNLYGGPGNDAIYVVWVNLSPCGVDVVPPVGPTANWIDIRGGGGNDTVVNANASFQTNLFGGDGNDHILTLQSSTIMDGEAGQDAVISQSSGGAESIYGGAGEDCLSDYNSSAAVFDCGPESHEYKESGRFPINSASCEIVVSRCF